MKRTAFVLAMGLGAAIWLASPVVTGRREPWDAAGPYFPLSLFTAGVVAGVMGPRRPWLLGGAIYLGQVMAILLGSGGDLGLFPLGAVLLIFYTLLSVAGAALGGAWKHGRRPH